MEKNFYHSVLSDDEWLLKKKAYDAKRRIVDESLFTLGNGYIGSRGVYEEIPIESRPGTYFAGIFDPTASKVSELVNAPNPFNLIVSEQGEKLNIVTMNVVDHERILDLKKGLLYRHTLFESQSCGLIDYQSLRFVSMADLHVGAMQCLITPLQKKATFSFHTTIDTSVFNRGNLTEGDTRHFYIHEAKKIDDIHIIAVKTLAYNITIGYAEKILLHYRGKVIKVPHKFDITLNKNETAILTKIVTFYSSKDIPSDDELENKIASSVKSATRKGFEKLLKSHVEAFDKKWQRQDIIIKGDDNIQAALRFYFYHLIIATHPNVTNVSVGAKTLSGEGYRGHVFWEAEILLLPCYLHTDPIIARNLIEYRYQRLKVAKEIAQSKKFKGAMFPWESADTGLDETPQWTKDFDGTIKFINTGAQAHHITADVFYALYNYFCATHDVEYMLTNGLIMMIEIARFWESRVRYNKAEDRYEIKHIIGPDEFHENINNNAYTNFLAAWLLEVTVKLLQTFEENFSNEMKDIYKKTHFDFKVHKKWLRISKKMYIPSKDDLIEQFEGFFSLSDAKKTVLDKYGLPTFPTDIDLKCIGNTQYVKQPDVTLLFFLFPGLFNEETVLKNYNFYEDRTLHKSSWSPPLHAALAAQLGLEKQALYYFQITLASDLEDIYSNTQEGIHGSVISGVWLTMVYGFCGIRIIDNMLTINPHVPSSWDSITLKFFYLGLVADLCITKNSVTIKIRKDTQAKWLLKQSLIEDVTISINKVELRCVLDKEYTVNINHLLYA